MELLLDPYLRELKDVQSKTIINEAINIFSCLNIAEKNEANDCVQYVGPDILNPRKISYENIHYIKEESLMTKISNIEKKE